MRKKILFVVTEDCYFVSHRLVLGLAAVKLGYEVVVATRIRDHGKIICDSGIRLIPLELSRRVGNPVKEIWDLYCLYRRENPHIIHQVALKPVVFGSFAALAVRSGIVVNAVSGLGWLFISSRFFVRIFQPVMRFVMVQILNRHQSVTIVQNRDDLNFLANAGVNKASLRMIPGVGANLDTFYPQKNEQNTLCIMLVARMLWDKGIGEFIEAASIINKTSVKARFILVGGVDLANPAAIPNVVLEEWHGKCGVEYWGKCDDMAEVWSFAHIACLPSYREGMPKSLIEAAASGLPIVTTDVPGCREVINNEEEGFLVPSKDSVSLAKALNKLIENEKLRKIMGSKARKRAKTRFCEKQITLAQTQLYEELLGIKS